MQILEYLYVGDVRPNERSFKRPANIQYRTLMRYALTKAKPVAEFFLFNFFVFIFGYIPIDSVRAFLYTGFRNV